MSSRQCTTCNGYISLLTITNLLAFKAVNEQPLLFCFRSHLFFLSFPYQNLLLMGTPSKCNLGFFSFLF